MQEFSYLCKTRRISKDKLGLLVQVVWSQNIAAYFSKTLQLIESRWYEGGD